MTNYYVKRRDELRGPYPTHTAALDVAAYMPGCSIKPPSSWRDYPRILLDIDSVDVGSERQMRELLAHDPLLHAMFRLGVGYAPQGQAR